MMQTGKVAILRFDPEIDSQPYYKVFEYPFQQGMSVLDVAMYIYENLDGTLSFSYCCRNSHCGLCGARINGRPGLMCRESATLEMTLEPLENMTVVRDLTVDRSQYEQRKDSLRLFLDRTSTPVHEPEKIDMEAHYKFKVASRCVECYSCVSGCPVMRENPNEFLGPAGFVQLARHAFDPRDELNRGILAASGGVYNCVTCRKCTDICPHYTTPEENIVDLRAMLYESGHAHASAVGLSKMVKETDKALQQPKDKKSFLEQYANDKMSKLGLFVGCNIDLDQRLQLIGTSAVKVLEKLGYEVAIPKTQVCCGTPLDEMGAVTQLEELAVRNIEAFAKAGCQKVITLCSGCGLSAKKLWPKLYKKATGEEMPFEVQDFSELIAKMDPNKITWQGLKLKISYHDPCSLKRGQGVYLEPRQVLRSIPEVEYLEMPEADSCCGGGGGLRTTNYELTQKIGQGKTDIIKDMDLEAVVTSCPTCIKQLTINLAQQRLRKVQVLHTAVVMSRAMGLE